eukprot:403370441
MMILSKRQHRPQNLFCALLSLAAILQFSEANYYFDQGADWTGQCENGTLQSPIDIPELLFKEPYKGVSDPELHGNDIFSKIEWVPKMDFYADYGTFTNKTIQIADWSTIKVDYDQGSLVFLDENNILRIFQLKQFHFHAPSEHTFNNRSDHYDLELHLVHQRFDADFTNELAVVGIFFDTKRGGNSTNPFLESLNLANMNFTRGQGKTNAVDLNELVLKLNKTKGLFHYNGSLTTPPCTQSVHWIVVNDPQPITYEQLKLFKQNWQYNTTFAGGFGNNRVVQPLNQRTIYKRDWSQGVLIKGIIQSTVITMAFATIFGSLL